MIISSTARRVSFRQWLNNLSTFAAVAFAGGLAVRMLVEVLDCFKAVARTASCSAWSYSACSSYADTQLLLVGLRVLVEDGRSLRRQLPEFLPLLPGEVAAGALAAILAAAYTRWDCRC